MAPLVFIPFVQPSGINSHTKVIVNCLFCSQCFTSNDWSRNGEPRPRVPGVRVFPSFANPVDTFCTPYPESWWLICETPSTSEKSHFSFGGGSVPCWKYGTSSSVSRASKYSVSLSTDTSSTVLSGAVGSVGSISYLSRQGQATPVK